MSLQGLVNNATGLQTLGITKIGHVYSILGHINSLLSSSSLAASQAASTEAGSSSSQLSNNVPKPKLPALRQPKVCTSMTKQAFRKFEFDWNMLKLHSTIPENQCAMHLYNCCVDDVQSTITATYPNFLTMDEKAVIDMLRNLVTQSSNPLVHRMSFAKISQLPSESIQHFITRLRTSAPDCSFLCPSCDADISTTNIRDQFIRGLHNHTLQAVILRSASTKPGITLTDVIHEAQSYEQSLSDQRSLSTSGTMVQSIQSIQPSPQIVTPSSSSEVYNASEEAHDSEVSAAFNSNRQSSFRRRRPTRNRKPNQLLASPRPCIGCGFLTHLSSQREESCKAWNVRCSSCKTVGHFASVCLWRRSSATTTDIDRSVGQANNLFALSIVAPLTSTVPASVTPLHTLVSHCATQLYLFPDTGANICFAGPDHLNELGVANSITRCDKTVRVVGGSQISCFGQIRVRISIGTHHTEQNLFFCRSVQRFFLSCQACKELGIIPPSFPVPPTSPLPPALLTPAELPVLPPPMASLVITEDRPRLPPPPKPTQLPFPPTHENIPLLKNFILDSFISSAFNRSKPFPKLSTPPAHIHLRPNAVPFACHTPALVAAHWEDSVKASLDRDVLAGVLIEVPIGEPSEWCSRMVVVAKKDGRPRRTVDYQKLNNQCLRETHHCRSPFRTACRVPSNTMKSVLDAVDGYHSVELDEVSSRLTTFITPWGRYRYLRYPQGHRAAGDAFNSRVYKILQDIPRLERLVDDVCLYDHNIESAFFHVWEFLTICAKNGVVLNKDKFQFCSSQVDFAGLTITASGVAPSTLFAAPCRNDDGEDM